MTIAARATAILLPLWLASACGDNLPPPCGDGHRVCDGQIRDPEGRALVLRGVNLASAHKHAPYADDFTPAHYAQLHAWGFRSLRFLISWAAVEPTPGTYPTARLPSTRAIRSSSPPPSLISPRTPSTSSQCSTASS